MARTASTTPNTKIFHRGTSLSVRYSFRGIDYVTPVLVRGVEADELLATGYVKASNPNSILYNNTLANTVAWLEQATTILLASDNLSKPALVAQVEKLQQEAEQLVEANLILAKKKQLKVDRNAMVDEVELPIVVDEIEELKRVLEAKLAHRDTLKKKLNLFEEDRLTHFIEKYVKSQTLSKSSIRNYNSIITCIKEYNINARVQDVNEEWLKGFVDWCYVSPIRVTDYKMQKFVDENGVNRVRRTDVVKKTRELPPRVNSTIKEYIHKIKGVLNYFSTRQNLLPNDVRIDASYNNYSFTLATSQSKVLSLELEEVVELFKYNKFTSSKIEKARDLFVLLCTTGLRQVDLKQLIPTAFVDGEIILIPDKTQNHAIEVLIPLNDISTAILEKYDFDIPRNCKMTENDLNKFITELLNLTKGNQYVFPSFQKIVKQVKYRKLEKVEKVDTRANLIKSHSGRQTFINYMIDSGIDSSDVMLMSGHVDHNTMMIYKDRRKSLKGKTKDVYKLPKQLD